MPTSRRTFLAASAATAAATLLDGRRGLTAAAERTAAGCASAGLSASRPAEAIGHPLDVRRDALRRLLPDAGEARLRGVDLVNPADWATVKKHGLADLDLQLDHARRLHQSRAERSRQS